MRKTARLSLALLILAVIVLHAPSTRAEPPRQPPPLPADLLFTIRPETDGPLNTIVRVDAQTLELSPFYVDAGSAQLVPLSWSPQGDLLAVYRLLLAIDDAHTLFPRQLCILNRDGVLQRCMDDGPPMHYAGTPAKWAEYYPIAWSPDGRTIFFDTEYPNNNSTYGYGRRLVEASVVTGETLRVVYDYPDPYPVSMSPDLNHVTVGFKEQWLGSNSPTFLYDLTSGVQLDASDLIPDNTGLYWTCWGFSPNGQYATTIARYNVSRYAPELEPPDDFREGEGSLILLLDMQGTIQHIVGEPEGSPAATFYLECPGWQPDEQAIVFYGWNADETFIMRYSLTDQQTIMLYEPSYDSGHAPYVFGPFIPSPNGTHIALTVSDGPNEVRHVAVLYPDGEIYRIPSPYRFGLYPLWVPPLAADGDAE